MAEVLKVLGQVDPSITTLTTLYTVPAATQVTASSLVVCNRAAVSIKFRVSVAVAGAADNAKQYLFYDTVLPKNSSLTLVLGITLGAADVVRVYTDTTGVNFSLFGVEVS